VLDKLGQDIAAKVDWSSPRLLCIAGDFTRYDSHAVKQINRSIELIRYRRFDSDYLMIELVHAPRQAPRSAPAPATETDGGGEESVARADPYQSQRIDYRLQNASAPLRDVWDAASTFLSSLGDDVQIKPVSLYYAFKRIRNFVCMELYPQKGVVLAFVKLDPTSVTIEPGFTRDVRKIGHFGTGDLEISMRTTDDVTKALPLFQRAYDQG
jgi:predicted transport protein